MGQPTHISSIKQLLGEGNDYRNFFEAFTDHIGLSGTIQIHNFGGVDELRRFLKAFVKVPGFSTASSLGIVRDAEQAETAALQSVQSSLTNAGLPVPHEVGVASAGHPTVRVLILPGDGAPGMLETLLCRTFHHQGLNRCIDEFFDCASALWGVSIANPDKARAHAYLMTTKNPHSSVGVAAKAGVWDLDHLALSAVRAFLGAL